MCENADLNYCLLINFSSKYLIDHQTFLVRKVFGLVFPEITPHYRLNVARLKLLNGEGAKRSIIHGCCTGACGGVFRNEHEDLMVKD